MAIAFDAVSTQAVDTGGSWTHSPVGIPKGVIVQIIQNNTTDNVTSVTYGGVGLTRITGATVVHTNGAEDGVVYTYFLGSGVPTGGKTVSVTVTGSDAKQAVCCTVTASTDTAVDGYGTLDSGSVDDPSVFVPTTHETILFAGLHSGINSPVNIAPGANYTELDEGSLVANVCYSFIRRTGTAGASLDGILVDWSTNTADEAGIGAVAIREDWFTANNNITLFMSGSASVNNNITLYINGASTAVSLNNNTPLFMWATPVGVGGLFKTLELYEAGKIPTNNLTTLYEVGSIPQNSNITLYEVGIGVSNNNLTLYMHNQVSVSGIVGMNMFVKGLDPADSIPPSSGSVNNFSYLYINGGSTTFGGTTSSTPSPLTNIPIFLQGAAKDNKISNMNLFIKNIPFSKTNNMSLYLYNNTERTGNGNNLYIKGLGGEDSDGYTPGAGAMNLFIARNTAAALQLFMAGQKFTMNNSLNMYINSNPTKNNNVNLALPYARTGFNNGVNLYSHGF